MSSAAASTVAGSTAARLTASQLWRVVTQLPPPLANAAHKGQSGRIAVIGGSKAYTGAPFFAAMTPLQMGADLSTVFCSVEAGIPIKAYAPDLMVRPCLFPAHMAQNAIDELTVAQAKKKAKTATDGKDTNEKATALIVDDMNESTERMNTVIIGPGLGKDDLITATVAEWMRQVRARVKEDASKVMPLVIDGDGINVLLEHTDILAPKDSAASVDAFTHNLLLTPNAMEFRRLWTKYLEADDPPEFNVPIEEHAKFLTELGDGGSVELDHPLAKDTVKLAKKLGGVTIIRKGTIDIITDGKQCLISATEGCPRRVGGQGDLLAGACGTFVAWARMATDKETRQKAKLPVVDLPASPLIIGAYAASQFSRRLQRTAFGLHGRSMLPSHLLAVLPHCLQECFPVEHVQVAMPKL